MRADADGCRRFDGLRGNHGLGWDHGLGRRGHRRQAPALRSARLPGVQPRVRGVLHPRRAGGAFALRLLLLPAALHGESRLKESFAERRHAAPEELDDLRVGPRRRAR